MLNWLGNCLGNWPTWLPLYIIQYGSPHCAPPCGKFLNYGFDADKRPCCLCPMDCNNVEGYFKHEWLRSLEKNSALELFFRAHKIVAGKFPNARFAWSTKMNSLQHRIDHSLSGKSFVSIYGSVPLYSNKPKSKLAFYPK